MAPWTAPIIASKKCRNNEAIRLFHILVWFSYLILKYLVFFFNFQKMWYLYVFFILLYYVNAHKYKTNCGQILWNGIRQRMLISPRTIITSILVRTKKLSCILCAFLCLYFFCDDYYLKLLISRYLFVWNKRIEFRKGYGTKTNNSLRILSIYRRLQTGKY